MCVHSWKKLQRYYISFKYKWAFIKKPFQSIRPKTLRYIRLGWTLSSHDRQPIEEQKYSSSGTQKKWAWGELKALIYYAVNTREFGCRSGRDVRFCSHPANHTAVVTGKLCIVVCDFLLDHPAENQENEKQKEMNLEQSVLLYNYSPCGICNDESWRLISWVSVNKFEYVNKTRV